MVFVSLQQHLNNHGITKTDTCYSDENLKMIQRLSDLLRFTVFRLTHPTLLSETKAETIPQWMGCNINGIIEYEGGYQKESLVLHWGTIYALKMTNNQFKRIFPL